MGQEERDAYRVGFVRSAREVNHAVEARKGRAIALVAMSVELLLCENVSTALDGHSQHAMHGQGRDPWWGEGKHGTWGSSTSQEKETMMGRRVSIYKWR
jgi:hypothetical protein